MCNVSNSHPFRDMVKEVSRLRKELKDLRSGTKGACPTCEVVGELNKKLEQQITKLTKAIKEYDEVMGFYGGPDAGITGQSIIKDGIKARELRNKHKEFLEGLK